MHASTGKGFVNGCGFAAALLLLLVFSGSVSAQTVAPSDLTGSVLEFSAHSGSAPFASSAAYDIVIAAAGNTFTVSGNGAAGLVEGSYTYTKVSTSEASLTLADSDSGKSFSYRLYFIDSRFGNYIASTGDGASSLQNGVFQITNSPPVTAAAVYPSEVQAAGRFSGEIAGAPGLTYAVESSADLLQWSSVTNVTLPDWSGSFSQALSGAARFYRVRLAGENFAPASLAGDTLNMSIQSGSGFFPDSGMYQVIMSTNGTNLVIANGKQVSDWSATFSYRKTGPDHGWVTASDSGGKTQLWDLAFTSPESGVFTLTIPNTANSESGSFVLKARASFFAGNMQFTLDSDGKSTVAFPANGSPVTLKATNSSGFVWTLEIPGDALLEPETISMTPFAGVNSTAVLFPIKAGLLLDPDGLQFAHPATLTLTAPQGTGIPPALLQANHDGTELHFILSTNSGSTAVAAIAHFSSIAAADPFGGTALRDEALNRARAAYDSALAKVKSLKRVVVPPLPPPDAEMSCDLSENEKIDRIVIEPYSARFFQREQKPIEDLLSAARALALLGDSSYGSAGRDEAADLLATAVWRRVEALNRAYFPDAKKMRPVIWLNLKLNRDYALLTGRQGPADLAFLQTWVMAVRDRYLNEIRTEHDYSKTAVVLQLARELAQLGSTASDLTAEMKNALHFTLAVDYSLVGSINPAAQITVAASGEEDAQLSETLNSLFVPATIRYTSGAFGGGATLQLPNSFRQDFYISNLEFCTNTIATVGISDFPTVSETWIMPGVPSPITYPIGYLESYGDRALASRKVQGGGYSFRAELKNKKVNAIDTTIFVPNVDGENFTLHLVLKHTPQ